MNDKFSGRPTTEEDIDKAIEEMEDFFTKIEAKAIPFAILPNGTIVQASGTELIGDRNALKRAKQDWASMTYEQMRTVISQWKENIYHDYVEKGWL